MIIKTRIHSFVGVMTNSSSETFVYGGELSLEQIRSIVEAVLETDSTGNNYYTSMYYQREGNNIEIGTGMNNLPDHIERAIKALLQTDTNQWCPQDRRQLC